MVFFLFITPVYNGILSVLTSSIYNGIILEAKNKSLENIASLISMKQSDHELLPGINFTNKYSVNCFDELALIALEIMNKSLLIPLNGIFLILINVTIFITPLSMPYFYLQLIFICEIVFLFMVIVYP